MRNSRRAWRILLLAAVISGFVLTVPRTNAGVAFDFTPSQTTSQSLTPLQLEIEKQRQRLSSADMEERRDALTRLRYRAGKAVVATMACRDSRLTRSGAL